MYCRAYLMSKQWWIGTNVWKSKTMLYTHFVKLSIIPAHTMIKSVNGLQIPLCMVVVLDIHNLDLISITWMQYMTSIILDLIFVLKKFNLDFKVYFSNKRIYFSRDGWQLTRKWCNISDIKNYSTLDLDFSVNCSGSYFCSWPIELLPGGGTYSKFLEILAITTYFQGGYYHWELKY